MQTALTKVGSTDEMQAGMNIPTFVSKPWIPDTVISTACIFLDNCSSIKLLQLLQYLENLRCRFAKSTSAGLTT